MTTLQSPPGHRHSRLLLLTPTERIILKMVTKQFISLRQNIKVKILFRQYLELITWIVALILLACMNPVSGTHYSLCIFKLLGIEFCPGCGIGHSISYLLQGDLSNSLHAHPLGVFAVAMILYRIYQLALLHKIFHFKKRNYEQQF